MVLMSGLVPCGIPLWIEERLLRIQMKQGGLSASRSKIERIYASVFGEPLIRNLFRKTVQE